MRFGLLPAIGLTLLGGVALGAWIGASGDREAPAGAAPPSTRADSAIERRIADLETALNAEREARQLLEDEVFALYDALDAIAPAGTAGDAPASVAAVAPETAGDDRGAGRVRSFGPANDPEARLEALVRAGFTRARAQWLVDRENELRMTAMQARFDAMRQGEAPASGDSWPRAESPLRADIGDAEYEMYLEATGRPTRVGVGNVFPSSPAQDAGLQPGDEITHYDGARVFGTADLVRQTMQGEPGQAVVVSFVRDGVPMQAVLPRGPLGVSTRWRR